MKGVDLIPYVPLSLVKERGTKGGEVKKAFADRSPPLKIFQRIKRMERMKTPPPIPLSMKWRGGGSKMHTYRGRGKSRLGCEATRHKLKEECKSLSERSGDPPPLAGGFCDLQNRPDGHSFYSFFGRASSAIIRGVPDYDF